MKNGTATQSDLRLIRAETSVWQDASDHAEHCPNLLLPYDPRWVFAVRSSHAIQATENFTLFDESRERLIDQASGLGLSRFDALAIISIVAGEAAAGRDPLGSGIESRLLTIGTVHVPKGQRDSTKPCGISVVFAAAITALIMCGFMCAVLML